MKIRIIFDGKKFKATGYDKKSKLTIELEANSHDGIIKQLEENGILQKYGK